MIDNIEYMFYYWGPYLFKSKLSKEYCEELLQKGKKTTVSAEKNLAGDLHKENYFNSDDCIWFLDKTEKIFKTYISSSENYYGRKICKNLKLEKLWINFMKKGDFNPIHTHNHDISFVLFLQIPEKLKEEQEKYPGTDNSGPGGLCFTYGEDINEFFTCQINFKPEVGDFFIFPAKLKHLVNPFKSEGERISVSGNIKLLK